MINILAGLMASILSLIVNEFIFSKLGGWVVVYLVPVGEEIFKTGSAYYLKTDIIITHLFFGILEASFDFFYSNKLAILLAVLTHLLLGILTFYLWRLSNNLIGTVVIVILVHITWNYFIRRLDHEINL